MLRKHLARATVRVDGVVERSVVLLAAMAAPLHLGGNSSQTVAVGEGLGARLLVVLDAEVDVVLVVGTVDAEGVGLVDAEIANLVESVELVRGVGKKEKGRGKKSLQAPRPRRRHWYERRGDLGCCRRKRRSRRRRSSRWRGRRAEPRGGGRRWWW